MSQKLKKIEITNLKIREKIYCKLKKSKLNARNYKFYFIEEKL